jgi:putative SOS response-associated peptidase YedK
MEIIEVRSLLKELSIRLAKDEFEIYNMTPGEVRPTDYAPIISQNDDGVYLESAKWGFKPYTGKGVIFNARSETMHEKPMFAKSYKEKRCVVPASEYFEWQDMEKGKKKKKHHIKDKDGNILYMAGLYRDTP